MILYLHGFRSSPHSRKAEQMQVAAGVAGVSFACPALPPSPRAAIALAQELITGCREPVILIGSSLGGFYATWLAERHQLRAVLVNPAVVPALDLVPYIGRQTNYHTGEAFDFTAGHVDELLALDTPALSRPGRYWLLVEEGDEVLDYRLAVARYAGARQTVLPGGDHAFSRWADYLEPIIDFVRSPA
ncbi:MAG: alpha/beta fold hydrolase [Proteobacteria bacterium]|nr:alpha/beta fold hydrolase [Pseudomonadota bacterium]HQR03844.1 YqiA/YcfP family alpha/beta fold hydrolase [Rhodocyclaceae bacterium]